MSDGQKRTLLDNRHPDYPRLAPEWEFYQQSYEGGQAYRDAKHLFKFPKETDANYKERVKRASRLNFTKQVLDLIVQYLGKEAPRRNEEKAGDVLKTFWKDVDRRGTSINDFSRHLQTMMGLYGRYYIVVDKPQGAALTKAQQNEKKLNPYAYGVSPLDVLDIVIDDATGYVTQALIREFTRGEIDLRKERESDQLKEQYRLWVKTENGVEWVLYEKDSQDASKPKIIGNGTISIPRVPIIVANRTGGSLVEDVASLDRKIYNYESLLDQILYDQTFSILRLPWGEDASDFYEKWEVKLSTKCILPYPPDSGVAPDFISPDASQGALIVDAIEKKVGQVYQVKNLQDTVGNSGQSKNNESGVAKGWDFEKLNAGLVAFADNTEKVEREIAQLVRLWEDDKTELPEDLIDYPDTFEVETLVQKLSEYTLLEGAVRSETFKKSLQKSLVRRAAPKLSPAEMDSITAEIDASISPEDEAANQKKEADKLRNP